MTGGDFIRHCAECNKNVYNLSELNAEQAVDLIREKEGGLCIRLFRRSDGTILTADCPVGLRERTRRVMRRSAALFASVFTFGLFVGCESSNDSDQSTRAQTTRSSTSQLGECVMGKIAAAKLDRTIRQQQ